MSMAATAAAAPGPADLGALLGALGPAEPTSLDASRCDSLNTICATSIAVSTVSCSTFSVLGVKGIQCTGASTFGGNGFSPAKLPGSVSWSGSGFCTSDCGGSTSGSGGASWGGLLGNQGSGTQITKGYSTVKKGPSIFRTCVTYGVVTDADATARAIVAGLTVSSVSAPHERHAPGATTACNF